MNEYNNNTNACVIITNITRIIMESSSSSESDSDSDEMENILMIIKGFGTNNIPRIRFNGYVEDVLYQYTDGDFKSHFR